MKLKAPILIIFIIWSTGIIHAQNVFISDAKCEYGFSASLPEVQLFQLTDYFQSSLKSEQNQIKIILPTPDGEFEAVLRKQQIHDTGFEFRLLSETDNKLINTTSHQKSFWTGSINGLKRSSVSLSYIDGKIYGLITTEKESYNIAYSKIRETQYVFRQSDAKVDFEFLCEELGMEDYVPIEHSLRKSSTSCAVPVSIYFECDYHMYLNFDEDATAVLNYVENLFVEVKNIYNAENLDLMISGISVWTSPDPYANNSTAIYDFQLAKDASGFSGDLAHLLTNDPGNHGGVAYVDELCGSSPYGYSDLVNAMQVYPAYSWDVQVIAHELGHNFGSAHTHDCVWGSNNNSQIDDCGNVYGTPTGNCYDASNPIIPTEGGTIMSYCHLDGVGIEFLNGFGIEPGAVIRAKHNNCMCDNADCSSAEWMTGNLFHYSAPDHGYGASQNNATHAEWYTFIADYDGYFSVNSCMEGVDTRVLLWKGQCASLELVAYSDDDCDSGSGNQYASLLDSIPVSAGVQYFVEWDDRWSNQGFDWVSEIVPLPPEMVDCDVMSSIMSGEVMDTTLHAKSFIHTSARYLQGHEAVLNAGGEITFEPGFEIELGTEFTAQIEDCNN